MAKGVHSKRRKRNMGIKRKVMEEKLFGPRQTATSERLFKRTFGNGDDSVITRKKNAFRYPKDPEAEYPQYEKPVYIEKRQRYLPIEYLIKNTGEKHKNKVKREKEEMLQRELDIAEGKINEGKAIDFEDMDEVVEDVNDMEIEETNKPKRRKEKDSGMDIDDIQGMSKGRHLNRRRKGFRHKTKSKYIMKY